MPTLDWIGKSAVVNHHRQVPYRLLQTDEKLSAGDPDAGNLLVQGDNLEALKALLPYYAGQVKCIYIDPPYNTGNEGWVYNDNVNSPEIRKWLDKAVGKEAEDLSRHDKWLCMMYPRLSLLREFMREDGVIFVSIDDNEVASLRILMDEIFGPQNFMALLVWKARQYLDSRSLTGVSLDHEYILVYSKIRGGARLKGKDRDDTKYKNPDNDSRGVWMSRSILGLANAKDRPNLHYDLIDPSTNIAYPCPANTGWRYSKETMSGKISEGRIIFPQKKSGRPREKVFLKELQTSHTGFPSIIDGVYTADGSHAIREIFGDQVFSFPKAPELIKMLVNQVVDRDSIVLDSFAGSGTTGQAVLELNQQDGGNRRFVLVEMDTNVSQNITLNRLRHVINGYVKKGKIKEKTKPLGSGFRFCHLGASLFDEHGNIDREVRFSDLARHVYFTETGVPIPKQPRKNCPLLGVYQGTAYYLLYNGVLGDKRPDGGNVLTSKVLALLPDHPAGSGPKVIYGEACRIGTTKLKNLGIEFKQLPYQIKTD
ncbi:MAG TPA: hypothetical protein DCM28_21260 [Phycisphaerales bacterium]|nr:hypothetical protein [Phycisphaerales bacterium]HCD31385.1 hypothetical protein [Phycisphaerales bacterium]|tara:strand:- start:34787 stop:36400 length:1614 start_codon:yes stop_codon:yes gene_type:complete